MKFVLFWCKLCCFCASYVVFVLIVLFIAIYVVLSQNMRATDGGYRQWKPLGLEFYSPSPAPDHSGQAAGAPGEVQEEPSRVYFFFKRCVLCLLWISTFNKRQTFYPSATGLTLQSARSTEPIMWAMQSCNFTRLFARIGGSLNKICKSVIQT